MTDEIYFKMAPPPAFTNRLFGKGPDDLTMPFCALSPTVSCSTALVALVLRHAQRKDPSVQTTDVARGLVKAWSLLTAGKIGNRAEVCGVSMKMLPLLSKGSIWSHAPVHAAALGGELPKARQPQSMTHRREDVNPGKAGRHSERKVDMEETVAKDVAQEPTGTESNDRWPRIKFPNAFVHPYEMTDQNGREWQKAICTVPDGVKVNGVDISGFALDAFLRDFHLEQKTLGKPVILALDPKEPLTLFKGKGEDREERKVMAWDLTKSMASHAREFKAQKQAERASHGDVSQAVEDQQPISCDDDRDPAPAAVNASLSETRASYSAAAPSPVRDDRQQSNDGPSL